MQQTRFRKNLKRNKGRTFFPSYYQTDSLMRNRRNLLFVSSFFLDAGKQSLETTFTPHIPLFKLLLTLTFLSNSYGTSSAEKSTNVQCGEGVKLYLSN